MNPFRSSRWLAPLLAAACALASPAFAQEEETAPDPVVYPVELKEDERLADGVSAFLQGETDAEGQRFSIAETQVMQPISVWAVSKESGKTVRLRIVKDNWDLPDREADSASTGVAEAHFRTYDGFKILVAADNPTKYALIVWVGKEIDLPVPSVAMPMSEYVKSQAMAKSGSDNAGAEPSSEAPAIATPAIAASGSDGNRVSLSYLEIGLIALVLLLCAGFGGFVLTRRRKTS